MTEDEERFDRLFRENYRDVLAYAVRRSPAQEDAEDVVAETFAVAWRRIQEVPEGEQARPWLFGTARLVRMNSHRADRRRQSLVDRLRGGRPVRHERGAEAEVAERDRIERALSRLGPMDREVLQLHVWERLTSDEIALSLDLEPVAARKRLQRARDRLSKTLDDDSEGGTGRLARTNMVTTSREVLR